MHVYRSMRRNCFALVASAFLVLLQFITNEKIPHLALARIVFSIPVLLAAGDLANTLAIREIPLDSKITEVGCGVIYIRVAVVIPRIEPTFSAHLTQLLSCFLVRNRLHSGIPVICLGRLFSEGVTQIAFGAIRLPFDSANYLRIKNTAGVVCRYKRARRQAPKSLFAEG